MKFFILIVPERKRCQLKCIETFRLKGIRSLSLGKLSTTQLQAEDFLEFGLELEDLKLAHASIDTIKSHAFKNVRGVRRLDLSENRISQIDIDAFAEVCTLKKKKTKLIISK